MIEILSNEELNKICKKTSLELMPHYMNSEGAIFYLNVGFADNEFSRRDFGEDVGNQLSFYDRIDFGSLSIQSIVSMSTELGEGVGTHIKDIEKGVEKVERCLDDNITYHMPIGALKRGNFNPRTFRISC